MALTWEPRWEPYLVNYAGIRIWTCRDKITGMIACPICINAAVECLNKEKGLTGSRYSEGENTYFFSERDLILHIRAHYRRPWKRARAKVRLLGEEESGE